MHLHDSIQNFKIRPLINFATLLYNYQCIIKCIGQIIFSMIKKGGERNGKISGP